MGALVRSTAGERYGEVTDVDHGTITVRWDREGTLSHFAGSKLPLRVEFAAGHEVLLDSTDDTAVVLAMVTAEPPVWRLLITGPRERYLNVPEAAIRPPSITDPDKRPLDVRGMRDRRVGRLKLTGTIVRRCRESPLDVLGKPLPADTKVLDALLEERSEERNEGQR